MASYATVLLTHWAGHPDNQCEHNLDLSWRVISHIDSIWNMFVIGNLIRFSLLDQRFQLCER